MAPERYFDSDPDSSVDSHDIDRDPSSSKNDFLSVTASAFCHLVILLLLSVGTLFLSASLGTVRVTTNGESGIKKNVP